GRGGMLERAPVVRAWRIRTTCWTPWPRNTPRPRTPIGPMSGTGCGSPVWAPAWSIGTGMRSYRPRGSTIGSGYRLCSRTGSEMLTLLLLTMLQAAPSPGSTDGAPYVVGPNDVL